MERPLIGVDDLETPDWAEGLARTADAGVLRVARAVPATARELLGWSWRASPRATVLVGVSALLSGAATSFGLLSTADVFTRLLAEGPTPDRVLAALPALALVAGAAVARGLLQAAEGALTAALVPRVERIAQDDLYRALIEVDLVAFDDADFTALVDQGERALVRIPQGARMLGDLVAGVVSVAAAVVTAGLVHPLLAPVVLLAAGPQAWATLRRIQYGFASTLRMISTFRRRDVTGDLIARRENAAEVRALTTQAVLLAEHERIAADLAHENERVGQRQNLLTSVGRGLSGLGTLAGYVVLGLLLSLGGLALPLAGTAVVALRTASTAVVSAVGQANYLFEAGLHVELYRRCLAEARSRRRPQGASDVEGPAVVTLTGVAFSYPEQATPAVVGVDLTLRRGETVALVGENGSGKSTLAKLLVGLYLPEAGSVCWDGRPTGTLDVRALHERVALVAQEPMRWPVTAENNVRIGRLARPDPDDVVFADARAEHAVFGALRELSAGGDRITVLVTHRLANIRSADRIVVLEHGRVVEQGTHDELMDRAGTYHDLFTLQGAAYR